MHLSVQQAPTTNVASVLTRLLRGGFSKAGVEHLLLPADQQKIGISADDLRGLLRTGLSFSSSEKGKEDWVKAGIARTVSIHETREGEIIRFVLNFDLVE